MVTMLFVQFLPTMIMYLLKTVLSLTKPGSSLELRYLRKFPCICLDDLRLFKCVVCIHQANVCEIRRQAMQKKYLVITFLFIWGLLGSLFVFFLLPYFCTQVNIEEYSWLVYPDITI